MTTNRKEKDHNLNHGSVWNDKVIRGVGSLLLATVVVGAGINEMERHPDGLIAQASTSIRLALGAVLGIQPDVSGIENQIGVK